MIANDTSQGRIVDRRLRNRLILLNLVAWIAILSLIWWIAV